MDIMGNIGPAQEKMVSPILGVFDLTIYVDTSWVVAINSCEIKN